MVILQGGNPLEGSTDDNYTGVQVEFEMAEVLSDNARTKSGSTKGFQYETFTVTPENASALSYYRSMYSVIFRANLVLENLGSASSDAAKRKFEAEARFLRGYAYFNLVRFYGDVPLVDKVISPEDTEIGYTRVDESLIYDLIVSDLPFAVDGGLDNSFRTRASKAAAQTLLAKVYLTLGSNYGEAQSLLEEVIGSDDYSLEGNFLDIFYNEGNSETIFAIGFSPDTEFDSQGFSAEFLDAVGTSTGTNYATDELVAAFETLGGNRGQYSFRVDPGNVERYQNVKYLPIADDNIGIPATTGNPRRAGNDLIVIRFADVLLLHVEAILAGGQETSATAALESFQLVRNRAGITDEVTTITKQDLLNERRVELAFENHRLLDLKRFGVAQEVLSAFAANYGFSFQATDLLLPIPSAEISISRGVLTQNPGY